MSFNMQVEEVIFITDSNKQVKIVRCSFTLPDFIVYLSKQILKDWHENGRNIQAYSI